MSGKAPTERQGKGYGIGVPKGETWKEEKNINQPDPPELPGSKPPTKEYTWRDPWLQLHM